MSDLRTRALEREGVVTAAWVRARMRCGKLPRRRVLCAAYLGCPIAHVALGWPGPLDWRWTSAPLRGLDHMAHEGQERGADVDLLDAFAARHCAPHLDPRPNHHPDRVSWVEFLLRRAAYRSLWGRPGIRGCPDPSGLDAEEAKLAKALARMLLTWDDSLAEEGGSEAP